MPKAYFADYHKHKTYSERFYLPRVYRFLDSPQYTRRIFKRAQEAVDYGKSLVSRYNAIFNKPECDESLQDTFLIADPEPAAVAT